LRRSPAAENLAAITMSKRESLIVAAMLAALCPFLTFVACWWTSAALLLSGVAHISERGIAMAAFAGMAAGLIIDALWLKRWVASFYTANLVRLGTVYAGCSVVAVASCMGLPPGNLLLGTLAGVYVGRRAFHAGDIGAAVDRATRQASLFTAAFTGVEAFAIGLLALRERSVVEILAFSLNTQQSAIAGPTGLAVVFTLVVVLMIFQFWCTSTAARLAYGLSKSPGGQPH
jgi:hypothetical protein